jgi:hypothetical protein
MSHDTPKAKRSFEDLTLSPENNLLQVSKTPKMEVIDNKRPVTLEEILDAIKRLTETVNSTKKEMEEIKVSVNKFHTTIESLSARMTANEKQTQMIANTNKRDLDRMKIAKDVVISGIPVSEEEKLSVSFQSVCRELGYNDTLPSVRIRRFKPKKSDTERKNQLTDVTTSSRTPPVFVEFAFFMDKREFLDRYFKKKDLNLSALGFANTRRIYVNERLTREDFECKNAALDKKKDGKIHSVSTRDGKVFVKQHSDSDFLHIDDKFQLESFN